MILSKLVPDEAPEMEPVAWCCGCEFLTQEEAARHHDEHAASWLARRGVEC